MYVNLYLSQSHRFMVLQLYVYIRIIPLLRLLLWFIGAREEMVDEYIVHGDGQMGILS